MSALGSAVGLSSLSVPEAGAGDAARGMADLAFERSNSIEYVEDKTSKAIPALMTGSGIADRRIAKVKCANCGATTEVHQAMPIATGEWPDAARALSAFGWATDGSLWFDGARCKAVHAQRVAAGGDKPIAAVERITDVSYARRMYGEPSPARGAEGERAKHAAVMPPPVQPKQPERAPQHRR